ncbi:MAG: hypothetical protein AAF191_01590 [Verrucomicrobiota bacterium]
MARFLKPFLPLLFLLPLPGCSPPAIENAPSSPPPPYSRLVRSVEYYRGGPQQASPPDGTLPVGTSVQVIRESGSYVLIETNSGMQAFVPADAIGE